MAKKRTEGQVTRKGDKPTATHKSKAVAPKGTKPPLSRQQSDEPAQHYIVRGVVSHPNNAPAAALTVIAFDKDVAGEDRLGEGATDAHALVVLIGLVIERFAVSMAGNGSVDFGACPPFANLRVVGN